MTLPLANELLRLAVAAGATVTTAESCTGGMVATAITTITTVGQKISGSVVAGRFVPVWVVIFCLLYVEREAAGSGEPAWRCEPLSGSWSRRAAVNKSVGECL